MADNDDTVDTSKWGWWEKVDAASLPTNIGPKTLAVKASTGTWKWAIAALAILAASAGGSYYIMRKGKKRK